MLLDVHSSIAIILMGKRELVALLNLSSWCLVVVERLFLAVPRGCLQFVIVVFPDHTHLLFSLRTLNLSPVTISHKRKSKGTAPAATSIASQDVFIGRSRHRHKVFFSEYLILIFQHGIILHEIVFRKSYFLKTNDTHFISQPAK